MSSLPHVLLVVSIDTEEDNWWPTREGVTCENIRELPELHGLLGRYGAVATYLTTHAVASDPRSVDVLRRLLAERPGEVASHLHPWNTPPLELQLSESHTNLKLLPEELQRRKLRTLTERIEENFGVRPRAYRAGRWSIGPSVLRAALEEGYRTDSSVLPYMYWHGHPHGPPHWNPPSRPYQLDGRGDVTVPVPGGEIVEITPTVGYTRWPWSRWARIDRLIRSRGLRHLHLPGILSRLGVNRRIPLTPETSSHRELVELTRVALGHEVPVLNLYFHSSVLRPGASPLVGTIRERDRFLWRLERYLETLNELADVEPVTLSEAGDRFRDHLAVSVPEHARSRATI